MLAAVAGFAASDSGSVNLADGAVTDPPDGAVVLAVQGADPSPATAAPATGGITRADAEAMVQRQVAQLSEQHATALNTAEQRANVRAAGTYLEGLIAARPGEAPGDLRLNTELSSLRASLYAGDSDKDPKWYMDRAAELSKTRADEIIEAGTDGVDHLPQVRGLADRKPLFDFDALGVQLASQIREKGEKFDLEERAG